MAQYPAVVCVARQGRAIDVDLLVMISNEHPIAPSRIRASLVLKNGSVLTDPVLAPDLPYSPFGPPGKVPEVQIISRESLAEIRIKGEAETNQGRGCLDRW